MHPGDRIKTALAAFVLGFLAGAGYWALLQAQRPPVADIYGSRKLLLDVLDRKVQLNPEQKQRIEDILSQERPRLLAIRAQMRPQLDALRKQTIEKVSEVLDPRQDEAFRQMRTEWDKQWEERRARLDSK